MKTLLHTLLLACLLAGLFVPTTTARAQDGQPPEDPAAPRIFEGVETEFQADAPEGAPLDASAAGAPENQAPIPLLRTRYLSIPGLDFRPSRSDLTFSSTTGGIFPTALFSSYGFITPLHLPAGAAVTRVDFFFVDNTDEADLNFSIHSINPETDTSFYLAMKDTSTFTSSPGIRSTSIAGSPIFTANNANAYRLRVEFGAMNGAQTFYGARVTYTLPLFVPIGDEFVTIAGADFFPMTSDQTYSAFGNHLYATNVLTSYAYTTRLDLPHGARVKEVDFFVIDNHQASLTFRLVRWNPETAESGSYIYGSSSGMPASPSVQKWAYVATEGEIFSADNTTNSYILSIEPASDSMAHQIVGARVRYAPSTAARRPVMTRTYAGQLFRPSGTGLAYTTTGGAISALGPLTPGRSFQMDLNLPDGVQIDNVTFYVVDNTGQYFVLTGRVYAPESGSFRNTFDGNSSSLPISPAGQAVRFDWLKGQDQKLDTYLENYRLRAEPFEAGMNLVLRGVRVQYYYHQTYVPMALR